MTLVVILRHDKVKLTLQGTIEYRIARYRPCYGDAFAACRFDSRFDAFDFVGAEQPVLSAMRILSGNRNAGANNTQSFEVGIADSNGCKFAIHGRSLHRPGERHMGRNVDRR